MGDRSITAAALQPLEPRRMLAGNVTAVLVGGDLVIRGDRADNFIEVTQDEEGDIVVNGEDGTTVNGEEEAEFEGLVRQLDRQPAIIAVLVIGMDGEAEPVDVEIEGFVLVVDVEPENADACHFTLRVSEW